MLRKSARIFLPFIFLMLFLLIGPAHLSAQPSPDIDPSLIPPTAPFHFTAGPQSSTGHAPRLTESARGSIESLLSPLAGNAAFALDIAPGEQMRYIPNTGTPGEWEYVGSVAGTAYYAGDFVGRDYSQMYVIDYNLNELHSLDTATAADTTIGACSPISGQSWTGATGTADGTLYASSTGNSRSYLYTVNIATGTATVVGEITNAPVIIDIAINAAGYMYGMEISNDRLMRINPATGAGTVIGSIGYNADYAQGMDFEEESGVLYLAAYNTGTNRGELRIANTTTGNSTLVGGFPDDVEVDALAFTPPTVQRLRNPGFESGWAYWYTQSGPILSNTSHNGSWSAMLTGEECWVYQPVSIPADALEVTLSYWITGVSSDSDWDNDILCLSIWDPTWQTEYVDSCFGLTYFYSYPGVWKHRIHRLEADELANVAGKNVIVAFRLTQDWFPGYHRTSTAYVDDTVLAVTRPVYDYSVYVPIVVR